MYTVIGALCAIVGVVYIVHMILREQNEIIKDMESRYDLFKTYEESQGLMSEIDTLSRLKNESLEAVSKDKVVIENLISKLSVKREDKNVYTNYLSLLDNVLEKGTQADLSSIDNVDLLVKFLHLAKDVDTLQSLQVQYEKYEQAKESLEQVQSDYDSLMNEILNNNNESVNISVSTDILPNAFVMATACACMVVLKKKKEKGI